MVPNMRLFRRENGIWYVEFERGKKRSLRTKDKKTAERLFKELQKEALKGKLILLEKHEKIRLSEFIKEYLQWSELRKARSSYKRDKWSLNRFLEIVGDKLLRTISIRDVEHYISVLLAQGRKPAGINVDFRHLKAAFSRAKEWGYIRKNPFSKVKPLKIPYKPPKFISKDEMERIISYLKDKDPDFHDIVVFALETGCRRKEIANLSFNDVDFQTGYIRILGKGGKERFIPITNRVRGVLTLRFQKNKNKVFPDWHPDTITHKWQKTMKALELKYRFHDIRHTTASWLAMQGTPLQFIQELLGHSSVQVTQIYAHLCPDVIKTELEKAFSSFNSNFAPNLHPDDNKILKLQSKS